MENDLVPVSVKGIMPTGSGCAVFLGSDEKAFVIHMDLNMGQTIAMQLQHIEKERPLTHDLIGTILAGLGIGLERIIINDIKDATFFSRIILSMKNELGSKLVELDARPSDAIVLALQSKKPIFVTHHVLDQVEDITDVLLKLSEENPPESDDEPPTIM